MTNVTFEEKIAYEIGVKLAHEAYAEKEANWQATQKLMGGLKGVVRGEAGSIGKSFQEGAKAVGGIGGAGSTGATNFRGVMGEIGQGLAQPWKNTYQRYHAGRIRAAQGKIDKGNQALVRDMESGALKTDSPEFIDRLFDIEKYRGLSDKRFTSFQGGLDGYNKVLNRGYIPRNAKGQVDYGQLATMGAGVGLAGTGAYMAGNAAFGGGNTYVNNPQVAPHQYYMNQLSNYFRR